MDDDLLIRFFNHQCTPREMAQIDEWLASDPANSRYLFEMERIWSLKNVIHYARSNETETSYRQVVRQIYPKSRTRKYTFLIRYAAIFALLVIASVYLYFSSSRQDSHGLNLIEVQRGEMASVTLSDGTKVWLNADTRFSYPDRFGSRNREVTLDGEAFFEVAHLKNKPFIVNGEKFNIEVLGTEFNLKAHKNEDAEISLKTGKIQVTDALNPDNKVLMKPHQQLRYSTNGKMILSDMDMSSVDNWRNGGIAFVSQPLSAIIKSLERKYIVTITLKDRELAGEIFNCSARPGFTLEQVLNLLRETQRIDYKFENANHVIIIKNDMPME